MGTLGVALILVAVVLVGAGIAMFIRPARVWLIGHAAVAAVPANPGNPAAAPPVPPTPAIPAVPAVKAHWWMVALGLAFVVGSYAVWANWGFWYSASGPVANAPAAAAPIPRPAAPGAPRVPVAPVYPAPNLPATELHERTYGDYYSERASGAPARILTEAKKLREENEKLRKEVERKADTPAAPTTPATPRHASIPGMGTHGLVGWQSSRYVSQGTTAYSADQGGYRQPLGREIAYAEGHHGPMYEKTGEWRLSEDGETVQVTYTDANGREARFFRTYGLEEFLARFVGRRT